MSFRRVRIICPVVAMVLVSGCGVLSAGPASPSATGALTSASSGPPATGPSPSAPPSPTASASPSATPRATATPAVAPTTAAACTTQRVLSTWSVTRLAEQTVTVPVDENNVSAITAEVSDGAGGVILFGSSAPSSLGSSLARLASHAPGGIAPLVMTDEEGGVVQRMANLVGSLPSARQMAATMSAAQIQSLAQTVGRRMRAAGVTMDLAPVLDLDGRPGPSSTNPDGTRSFSPTESIAAADGTAFAKGLLAAGVVPVVKHFPGLGGASGNTDNMAATTLPWSTLQGAGLQAFAAAIRAGVPAVMIANASVPGLTGLPASLSPTVITTVLRGQLGFGGLVITDSLSATAVHAAGYSVSSAAVQALRAGADMVLFNGSASSIASLTAQVVQAIAAAVSSGKLSRARLQSAVTHILTAKHVSLCQG